MKGIFRNLLSWPKPKKKALSLEEYVKLRIENGEDKEKIREELLKDLEEDGPIFKDFKEAIKPTFENSVSRFGEPIEINGEQAYKMDAMNLPKYPCCLDCLAHNGEIKTMKEWEKIGLAGAKHKALKNKCWSFLMTAYADKVS